MDASRPAADGPWPPAIIVGSPSWRVYGAVVLLLLVTQLAFSQAGGLVAARVPPVDDGWFVQLSVHHLVQAALTVSLVWLLASRWGLDFGLRVGDARAGWAVLGVFALAWGAYLLVFHLVMSATGHTRVSLPSDPGLQLGVLGFQVLLTGPCEELLFRALPITLLAALRPRKLVGRGRWSLTVESAVAAILFAAGHVGFSLAPLALHLDPAQLATTFVLGALQGVVYQRTRSVLWPMALHSLSNGMVTVGALAAGWTA